MNFVAFVIVQHCLTCGKICEHVTSARGHVGWAIDLNLSVTAQYKVVLKFN